MIIAILSNSEVNAVTKCIGDETVNRKVRFDFCQKGKNVEERNGS